MKTKISGYRPVAFRDTTTGDVMVIGSTVSTTGTLQVDGRTLPLYELDVSSHSHPVYAGAVATQPRSGQIERYRRRYGC